MPKYLFTGPGPVHFPTLGLYLEPNVDEEGNPTGEPVEFETDQPVASLLVLNEDRSPTYDGAASAPNNVADVMDTPADRNVAEPIAEATLEELNKAELLDLAQDLELHGRSQMTKPELIAALREAAQVTPEQQAAAEVAIDAAVATVGQTEGAAGADTDDTTEE